MYTRNLISFQEQLGILSLKDFDHCHVEEVHTNSAAKLQLSIACLLCLIFMVSLDCYSCNKVMCMNRLLQYMVIEINTYTESTNHENFLLQCTVFQNCEGVGL